MEEFIDFSKYIRQIESQGAHLGGICKVIPPVGWFHREYDLSGELGDMMIKTPIRQCVNGKGGAYNVTMFTKKDRTVREFYQYCEEKNSFHNESWRARERQFWRCMGLTSGNNDPLYGTLLSL